MSDPIKKIRIKRGLTAGNVPSTLSFGELAINTFDRTLFVGGITGGVQDYPLQKNYVYNTYSDFVLDINAGVYGTAGNESWFQVGDLFIERNSKNLYSFLPSATGPTSVATWFPLTVTGGTSGSQIASGSSIVIIQSYLATTTVPLISDGALWFNTDTGILYNGYLGPSGNSQWVQATTINKGNNQQ